MLKHRITIACAICFLTLATSAFCQAPSNNSTQVIQQKVHVVQKGELSINIIKKYGIDLKKLSALNPGKKLNRLSVGDVLVVGVQKAVPVAKTVAPAVAKETEKSSRPDKIALMVEHEDEAVKKAKKDEQGDSVSMLSVLFKLIVVSILAYITIVILKVMTGKRDGLPGIKRELKIVDTVKLSSTSSVHLIDAKGKTYLLGCSPGQVSLITEIEPEVAPVVETEPQNKFADYLAKYSDPKSQGTPSGRVANMLRDAATHLQSKRGGFSKTSAGLLRGCATYIENKNQSKKGDNNEA